VVRGRAAWIPLNLSRCHGTGPQQGKDDNLEAYEHRHIVSSGLVDGNLSTSSVGKLPEPNPPSFVVECIRRAGEILVPHVDVVACPRPGDPPEITPPEISILEKNDASLPSYFLPGDSSVFEDLGRFAKWQLFRESFGKLLCAHVVAYQNGYSAETLVQFFWRDILQCQFVGSTRT
jgi:hypothetical protein